MRFLFIHFTTDVLGGIETLIGRMSHFLVREGHEVFILTTTSRRWAQVLPTGVRCAELGDKFRYLFYPLNSRAVWRSLGFPTPDVIKTFDLPTSWCGSLLASDPQINARLVAGIYNPYVFEHRLGNQVRMHGWFLYRWNYLKNIPYASRVVCDVEIQKELQKKFGRSQTARLWPIPVDGVRFKDIVRTPIHGRIVSVGRLAPMKEYNFYMIDVVGRLRARGHDVTWTVYGSGPYREEMLRRVARLQLGPYIVFKGDIDYNRLGDAFRDAHVFVGMGTSIIEASFARLPNVLALAYDATGVTYGPLYRLPFGRIGQVMEGSPPTLTIETEIERILNLCPQAYGEEERRVFEYVQPYDLNSRLTELLDIVTTALPPRRNRALYFCNYFYSLARTVGIHLDDILLLEGNKAQNRNINP